MTVAEYTQIYERLNETDRQAADSFILFLYDKSKESRVQRSIDALDKLNALFADDKGWESEDAMIEDMAEFRRERVAAAKAGADMAVSA